MEIKFTKSAGGHNVGDIVDIEDRHAETIISLQLAEKVQTRTVKEKIERLEPKRIEKIEVKAKPRKK